MIAAVCTLGTELQGMSMRGLRTSDRLGAVDRHQTGSVTTPLRCQSKGEG